MNSERHCPKCGEDTLRTWAELGDDEREVVRRLGTAADLNAPEVTIIYRWCTRCWHEEVEGVERYA